MFSIETLIMRQKSYIIGYWIIQGKQTKKRYWVSESMSEWLIDKHVYRGASLLKSTIAVLVDKGRGKNPIFAFWLINFQH